jgi:ClpX C4-type zinc finger protein
MPTCREKTADPLGAREERRMDEIKRGELRCSFCGKDQRQAWKLIAGPTDYICEECVVTCGQIVKDEANKKVARAAEAAVEPPPPPELPRDEEARRRELGKLARRLAVGCLREQGVPKVIGQVAMTLGNALDPDSDDADTDRSENET